MKPFGLHSLISPRNPDDLLEGNWSKTPFITHGLNESVREIFDLPFLQSREALIRCWSGFIQAHLPDIADESSSIEVRAEDAEKLFKNRMGLLFNNVEKLSPFLRSAVEAVRSDLGLPAATYGRCMVYATPDGKGTAPHFDQNINFVLQLQGTKKWWLASNESVENPTERHTIGQPITPELSTYAPVSFPTAMPEGSMAYTLEPGSVLFVPRGYWHCTEAAGDALALNFTYNQPAWLDVFLAALRSRLVLSPEWRELADGVGSTNQERRKRARCEFDGLLLELTTDLPNWSAENILDATEGALEI